MRQFAGSSIVKMGVSSFGEAISETYLRVGKVERLAIYGITGSGAWPCESILAKASGAAAQTRTLSHCGRSPASSEPRETRRIAAAR